jgi:hypothetical protein
MDDTVQEPQKSYPGLGALWVLSLLCFPAIYRFDIGLEYITYDWGGMIALSLGITLLLLILMCICVGKNKALRYFLIFLVAPSFLPWVYFVLYQINVRFDTSPQEIFEAEILDKEKSLRTTTRSGPTTYRVTVTDWHDPELAFRFKTDLLFYNNYRTLVGNHIRFLTHKGFLGYEWIEKCDVVEGAAVEKSTAQ